MVDVSAAQCLDSPANLCHLGIGTKLFAFFQCNHDIRTRDSRSTKVHAEVVERRSRMGVSPTHRKLIANRHEI